MRYVLPLLLLFYRWENWAWWFIQSKEKLIYAKVDKSDNTCEERTVIAVGYFKAIRQPRLARVGSWEI